MPPADLDWRSWWTLAVVAALIGVLVSRRMGADIAFLCALAALLVAGVLDAAEAVAGFANPAVITVGLLYIVARGLQETGGMTTITRRVLGRPRGLAAAQVRLLVPVAGLSAFVNNTPIVAMFLPVLHGWARRNRLNPAQLFMPLSFAAMLGGTCTLIGTSTNIVVNELMVEHATLGGDTAAVEPMGLFTLAWVGVPVTLVGLAWILLAGPRLLPKRDDDVPLSGDPREYTVWMRVGETSPVVGRSIEEAGLRHLGGLFLAEVDRGDERLVAVGPEQVLRAGDRLRFVGVAESVVELQAIQGLEPDTTQIDKLDSPRHRRRLIEAVVSESSPLVGKSVREGRFRTAHNAVIIAVHRAGERLHRKIGDIVLRPGDTLLLEAPPEFLAQHRNSSAFYLVSERPEAPVPRWALAWVAIGLLGLLVLLIGTRWLDMMSAALLVAMLMVLTRCCTGNQARQAVDWQVLIVIGAAFGIARAIETTGVAAAVAEHVLGGAAGLGLIWMLAAVYALTVVLTSLMTNVAAATLVFPIAFQFAAAAGHPFLPFAAAIAVGASASFLTPIGYQTNLMVMGPGGYSWGDFLRFGGPLTVLVGAVCVVLARLVYT